MRVTFACLLGCLYFIGCNSPSSSSLTGAGGMGATSLIGGAGTDLSSSGTATQGGGAGSTAAVAGTAGRGSVATGGVVANAGTGNFGTSAGGGGGMGGTGMNIDSNGTAVTTGGVSPTTGSNTDAGGNGGASTAATTVVVGPGTYALKPPNQCLNQQSIQNCKKGVASSTCGGVCSTDYGSGSQSACEGGKSGVPINFACPRFLLFSDEFNQAAIDDSNLAFNYGIVGHDVDKNGVDGTNADACCQCYQIVFDYPKENQVWVDPNAASPVTAVPPPKAMIVQSFNTGTAGPGNFDIYMGAGGFGANNGCFSVNGASSPAGLYQYIGYPSYGQPGGGGVKPAGDFGNQTACKTNQNWVTAATIGSTACVAKVTAACSEIKSNNAQMQAESTRSCIQSNDPNSFYHLNWYFWVKRVECPAHLTEVTGCKLAAQGLPGPDPSVTNVAQAKAAGFRQKDNVGNQYFTTTMEDCCMPTCAWAANVKGTTKDGYNSFYSCNQAGVPQTQ